MVLKNGKICAASCNCWKAEAHRGINKQLTRQGGDLEELWLMFRQEDLEASWSTLKSTSQCRVCYSYSAPNKELSRPLIFSISICISTDSK